MIVAEKYYANIGSIGNMTPFSVCSDGSESTPIYHIIFGYP
jgi:hypothetical protein